MPKLIAIILPSFNRANYIVETLRSILSQQLSNSWRLAVVVVDDGSTDQTAEILRREFSDTRLHYIYQANLERAVARNHGARFAFEQLQADWILFFDSDDILFPGALLAYVESLESKPSKPAAVYSAIQSWDGKAPWPRPLPATTQMPEGNVAWRVLHSPLLPLGATLIRAETFSTLGGFNERPELIGSEDFEFLTRLGLTGEIVYLPQTTVLYRQHAHNTDPEKYLRSTDAAYDLLQAFLLKRWQGPEARRAGQLLSVNCDLCRVGALNQPRFVKEARTALQRAFIKNPQLIFYFRAWRMVASVLRVTLLNFVKTLLPTHE